ncbi:MAG: hypothetical protein IJ272_08110 [Clostridia bacterium]|nr:hypothetical protein [Clostridia bacterium]
MKSMQIKYARTVKQNATNGIVVTHYPDMVVVQCTDYKSDGNVKGYVEYRRTAKQNKSIMGFTQEF